MSNKGRVMKKRFIVLAVSGLLLVTSVLYAQETGVPKSSRQGIFQVLTTSQRENVKAYIQKNASQRKVLAAKLKQDKLAFYSIITTANDIDASQLQAAIQTLQSDESEVIKNRVNLLHYIYTLADPQQQVVIASQIKEMLQHNRHQLSRQKKA